MKNNPDNHLTAKLYKMLETLALINSTQDLDTLLKLIMKSVKEVMEAEASSLMLLDPEKNELYFNTVEGGSDKIKEIRIKVDQGIAGHVVQTQKPMIVNDVTKSEFFLKSVDKKTTFHTRSIICVPLLNRNKVIGVIEALNKTGNQDFTPEDERLFMAFSNQVSIAIDNARLYNMAFYDALTKVFMRRYFEAWLSQEFSRVKRYKTDLSLIMFDIDHFKKINDTYGHQAGDFVLSELSQVVKEAVREADIVARYGGEEFVVCLPETKVEEAKYSAERIRASVEKKQFIYEGTKIPVTVSLGVASFRNTPEDTVEQFIKDADTALYHSKESGRNQFTLYSSQLSSLKKKAA